LHGARRGVIRERKDQGQRCQNASNSCPALADRIEQPDHAGTRGVNRSANRIDRGKLASRPPIPTPTMIVSAGDEELSANLYSASPAAGLSSAINRYFGKEPQMAVKPQTKVEGNKD